jgi:hypothetical protein
MPAAGGVSTMSWTTIIWSMAAAVCLAFAAMHFVVFICEAFAIPTGELNPWWLLIPLSVLLLLVFVLGSHHGLETSTASAILKCYEKWDRFIIQVTEVEEIHLSPLMNSDFAIN